MKSGLSWHTPIVFQMRLGDEQALLYELKRQQLKCLDEQQKVYADDLSRLECSKTSTIATILPRRILGQWRTLKE